MRTLARVHLFSILFAVSGALLILAATSRYGAGLTPDSACYISTARSLVAGRGYFQYEGGPYVSWAPLFPTLLAALHVVGVDPVPGARCLNAVVFGLILLASVVWLRRHTRAWFSFWVGAAAVWLAVPVQEVSCFAWSEPLFILFVLLFALKVQSYLEDDRPASLIAAAIFAALVCLTRYIGVTVILAGAVLLLASRARRLPLRVRDLVIFSALAAAPLFAWTCRNHAVAGTWMGHPDVAPESTPVQHLILLADIVGAWFLPDTISPVWRLAGAAILLIIAPAAARVVMVRAKRSALAFHPVWLLSGYVFTYTVWMVVTASVTYLTPFDTRYWSLIYIPVILLVVRTLDEICVALGRRDGDGDAAPAAPIRTEERAPVAVLHPLRLAPCLGVATVVVVSFVLLARPLLLTVASARFAIANGTIPDPRLMKDPVGYARLVSQWQDSELMRYLKENPPSGRVYTNNPVPFYLLSGCAMALMPLRPQALPAGYTTEGLTQLEEAVRNDGSVTLIWFDGPEEGVQDPQFRAYRPEELQGTLSLQLLAARAGGTVYRAEPPVARVGLRPGEADKRF